MRKSSFYSAIVIFYVYERYDRWPNVDTQVQCATSYMCSHESLIYRVPRKYSTTQTAETTDLITTKLFAILVLHKRDKFHNYQIKYTEMVSVPVTQKIFQHANH